MHVDKFGNTLLRYCSAEFSLNTAVELLLYGPKQQLYVTNNEGLSPITTLKVETTTMYAYMTNAYNKGCGDDREPLFKAGGLSCRPWS